ncbi:unnamed protein product, partial [Symbiodinium sp. KB8]
ADFEWFLDDRPCRVGLPLPSPGHHGAGLAHKLAVHALTGVWAASSSRSLRRPTQSPLRPRLRHGALLGEAPGRKVRRDAAGDGAADAAALARSRGALPQPAQFAAVRLEGGSGRDSGWWGPEGGSDRLFPRSAYRQFAG